MRRNFIPKIEYLHKLMMWGDEFGVRNRLKEIRMREYMMSSSEFAKYLEVPISTYSQWEKATSNPPLQKAFEIAAKLNRNLEDIWYSE